jgi:hypothetical protein
MTDTTTQTPKTLIATSELKQALKLVLSGTGTDQALEGADSVLFSGGYVHAHNGKVSVSVPLKDTDETPISLHGCLKAKNFAGWVSKIKSETIAWETLPDSSWQFTAGEKNKDQLLPTRFEDPLTEQLEKLGLDKLEWLDLPPDFHGLMSLVRLDNQKYTAPFVAVRGATAYATDGIRLNSCEFDRDMGEFAVQTGDLKAVLSTPDLQQYALASGWVHFLTSSGIIWSITRISGATYNYTTHNMILKMMEDGIASGGDNAVETDLPVGLADTMDRLGVYSSKDSVSGMAPVQLKLSSGGMAMLAKRPEGSARASLEWPEPLPEGVDHEMAVSGPFLKEAAARNLKLHVVQVEFRGAKSTQIAFKGGNFTQVVKAIAKAGA